MHYSIYEARQLSHNVKIFAMEIFINQSMTGKIYSANIMLGGEDLRVNSYFELPLAGC